MQKTPIGDDADSRFLLLRSRASGGKCVSDWSSELRERRVRMQRRAFVYSVCLCAGLGGAGEDGAAFKKWGPERPELLERPNQEGVETECCPLRRKLVM
jgi:hypothetical protein